MRPIKAVFVLFLILAGIGLASPKIVRQYEFNKHSYTVIDIDGIQIEVKDVADPITTAQAVVDSHKVDAAKVELEKAIATVLASTLTVEQKTAIDAKTRTIEPIKEPVNVAK